MHVQFSSSDGYYYILLFGKQIIRIPEVTRFYLPIYYRMSIITDEDWIQRSYIHAYDFIFSFVHEGRYDLTEDIEYQVFIYLDLISLWKWK